MTIKELVEKRETLNKDLGTELENIKNKISKAREKLINAISREFKGVIVTVKADKYGFSVHLKTNLLLEYSANHFKYSGIEDATAMKIKGLYETQYGKPVVQDDWSTTTCMPNILSGMPLQSGVDVASLGAGVTTLN